MKTPPLAELLTPDSLVDPAQDNDESAWPVYSEPLDAEDE